MKICRNGFFFFSLLEFFFKMREEKERKFFNKQGHHLTGTFLINTSLSHTFTSGQFVLSFNVMMMMMVSTLTMNKYIKIVSPGAFYFVFLFAKHRKDCFSFPLIRLFIFQWRFSRFNCRWESQWSTINDWLGIVEKVSGEQYMMKLFDRCFFFISFQLTTTDEQCVKRFENKSDIHFNISSRRIRTSRQWRWWWR